MGMEDVPNVATQGHGRLTVTCTDLASLPAKIIRTRYQELVSDIRDLIYATPNGRPVNRLALWKVVFGHTGKPPKPRRLSRGFHPVRPPPPQPYRKPGVQYGQMIVPRPPVDAPAPLTPFQVLQRSPEYAAAIEAAAQRDRSDPRRNR
jgi:hypothetical protein